MSLYLPPLEQWDLSKHPFIWKNDIGFDLKVWKTSKVDKLFDLTAYHKMTELIERFEQKSP